MGEEDEVSIMDAVQAIVKAFDFKVEPIRKSSIQLLDFS